MYASSHNIICMFVYTLKLINDRIVNCDLVVLWSCMAAQSQQFCYPKLIIVEVLEWWLCYQLCHQLINFATNYHDL